MLPFATRPRRFPFAAAALASLLLPAVAHACGLCLDASLRRRFWWSSLAPSLFLALGAEALAFLVYCAIRRHEPRYRRTRAHLAGAVAALIAGLLSMASGTWMTGVLAASMLFSFFRSLLAEREPGRHVGLARIALVVLLLAAGLARSHPSRMSTERLVVLLLVGAPEPAGLAPEGWAERELTGRSDAPSVIEALLARQPGGSDSQVPTERQIGLLRLHRLAAGRQVARARWCAGWDLERYERNYGGRLGASLRESCR